MASLSKKPYLSIGMITAAFSLAAFVIIGYNVIAYEKKHSEEILLKNAEVDARTTSKLVFDILYEAMSKGWDKNEIARVVKNINSNPDVVVRVFRGEVVSRQFGDMPGEKEVLIADAQLAKSLQTGSEYFSKSNSSYRFIFPIIAKNECLSCHTKSFVGAVHGVIEITQPSDKFAIVLFTAIKSSAYILAVSLAFLIVCVFWVFRKHVVSPVCEISKQTDLMIGCDDFSKRISLDVIPASAEVHSLKENFNKLLDFVQSKQSQINTKNDELKLMEKLFENSREGILISDKNNLIVAVNPALLSMSGYEESEILGLNPRIFSSGIHNKSFYQQMWNDITMRGHWSGLINDRRKDGSTYEKWISIDPVFNEQNELVNYISIHSDNTVRRDAEKDIHRLAYYDTLTGLPNRVLLKDRLTQAISLAERNDTKLSVLFLDLDRFKFINDSMGHAAGDKLLQKVAKRLTECVREVDTVARIGGDEFVVLLQNTGSDGAVIVSENIIKKFELPYSIEGQDILSRTSIGATTFPDDGRDIDTLTKNADIAMYQAKKAGRNVVRVFNKEMDTMASAIFSMEKDISHALDNGEFSVEYQLQFNLSGEFVCGAEALLRWKHPVKGMVPPGTFISIAEETGQIGAIGEFVLRRACETASKWYKAGYKIPVSVNVSMHQLRKESFLDEVQSALKDNDLPASLLELEITEGVMMDHQGKALELLTAIRSLGVMLSIDDFGTGYSSLSYLKRMPVTQLKIDRSFIKDIEYDENDTAIVQSIIELGHRFGMTVLAEGVEAASQAEILKNMGCDRVQGYLYGRPMTEEIFTGWVSNANFGKQYIKGTPL